MKTERCKCGRPGAKVYDNGKCLLYLDEIAADDKWHWLKSDIKYAIRVIAIVAAFVGGLILLQWLTRPGGPLSIF